jgi:hypothetical protein
MEGRMRRPYFLERPANFQHGALRECNYATTEAVTFARSGRKFLPRTEQHSPEIVF